jgi:hypothetical protein
MKLISGVLQHANCNAMNMGVSRDFDAFSQRSTDGFISHVLENPFCENGLTLRLLSGRRKFLICNSGPVTFEPPFLASFPLSREPLLSSVRTDDRLPTISNSIVYHTMDQGLAKLDIPDPHARVLILLGFGHPILQLTQPISLKVQILIYSKFSHLKISSEQTVVRIQFSLNISQIQKFSKTISNLSSTQTIAGLPESSISY